MTNTINTFLGIDISKSKFDVAVLLVSGKYKHKKFDNNLLGFNKLVTWLDQFDVTGVHACMESTNIYGNALAEYLYDHDIRISVVNPARVKGFSTSELSRTKNDQQDASLIARFCRAMVPDLWQPEPLNVRKLKAMARRLDALVDMKQQESNRLEVSEDVIQKDILSHIDDLEQRIKGLKKEIQNHIDDDPGLKQQKELLLTIPGLGEKTVATLLSYFASIQRFDSAKKLASFCGVAPREFQSGSSIKSRGAISKTGSAHLRKSLFFPAMVALRYNPELIKLKDRLTAAGKPKMVIIVAAMRKLIHIIFGVLKNNKPFSANLA